MVEHIIILTTGIILSWLALNLSYKQNKIKKTGVTAEGTVFELLHDQNTSFNLRYPVIRFLTLNKEWITETANIGIFAGFYKNVSVPLFRSVCN